MPHIFYIVSRHQNDGYHIQEYHVHWIRGVQQILTDTNESWAIRVEGGSHNIFEQLNLHHNEGPGLYIHEGGYNLVLNCDAHNNYDPDRGGENADGFGGHGNAPGNVFRGCRAWNNSDDGYDLIWATEKHIIAHSWAWHNGYVRSTDKPAGNGNGFKSGGYAFKEHRTPDDPPRHVIRKNVAFDNRRKGIDANYHPTGIDFINNTSFRNGHGFNLATDGSDAKHFLRNNIAFQNNTNLAEARSEIDDRSNTWNDRISVSSDDFRSLAMQQARRPRQEDGSLPEIDFLHLAEDSDLINAGVDAGLPYNGSAPDLGAFEFTK